VPPGARAAVITASNRSSRGERTDTSGHLLADRLRGLGFAVGDVTVVPDDVPLIQDALRTALGSGVDLVVTTGGTGVTPTDVTPEATRPLLEREVPGIAEAIRQASRERVPTSILSRGLAGTVGPALVVNLPGSPGGVKDGLAVLAPVLGQPVVVENRPGAQGAVGSEAVMRAEPDGHTLLVVTSTHNLNKYQLQHVPYDPLRDFAPVALLTRQVLVLVAAANQPFDYTRALVAHARSRPGEVGFGATEALTAFAGHEFNRRAGVRMEEVQYRGGSLLMNDIVAGHLPTGWTSTASAMPHLATGRVRVLAVSTAERTPLLPDVPTVEEACGLPGFDSSTWYALLGPPGLPAAVRDRMNAEVARIVGAPDFRRWLVESQGIAPPEDLSPEGFRRVHEADIARWAEIVRRSGARVD